MASRRQPPQAIFNVLARASQEHGIPFDVLKKFAGIESTFNPRAKTGSYKGLFQLSPTEFKKNGGRGNIYDPEANTNAFAKILKTNIDLFQRKTGEKPTGAQLYLMHQQGSEGAVTHLSNPDKPAWQNMAATREGREKGPGWAKKAIWGNVPSTMKKQFGSVNNVTSGQFVNMWNARYAREGGGSDVAFDPSAAKTPGMPQKGFRVAENTMDLPEKNPGQNKMLDRMPEYASTESGFKTSMESNEPDQNVVMVGGGEDPPPTPERRDALQPGVPERRMGARMALPVVGGGGPASEPQGGGFDPLAQKAFGGDFGHLYGNRDQGSPLLSSIFGSGGGAPPPVPTFRDFFSGLGGFG